MNAVVVQKTASSGKPNNPTVSNSDINEIGFGVLCQAKSPERTRGALPNHMAVADQLTRQNPAGSVAFLDDIL